jgi:hypothetical protein
MKEKRKDETRLRVALQQLPRYAPPLALWDEIAAELERGERKAPLREALAQLPHYAPPEHVWPAIAAQLPSYPQGRRRALWAASAAAAAAAALLLAFFFLRPPATGDMQATYIYQVVEASPPALFANDWDEDEGDLQAVAARFAAAPVAQVSPDFELWHEEWAELNQARADIVAMMQRYGRDGSLIRQLAAIERERSALARKMAAQI